jgi:tetratricopeptide (TPR) repeat protein
MNEFGVVFITLLLSFSIIIICRALTVAIHEFGHALPALIFTQMPVKVYIGSYGDEKGMIKLSIWKNLLLSITKNPLTWQKGLAEYDQENISVLQRFIITLLGPASSLIFALLSLWACFYFDLHGFIKLFGILFCISAFYDFLNIYPNSKPIFLTNNKYTYRDGYKLKLLLQERRYEITFKKGMKLIDEEEYENAYHSFKKIQPERFNYCIHKLIVSFSETKQFTKAKDLYDKLLLQSFFKPDSFILCSIGVIESNLHNYQLAFDYYEKALDLDGNNGYALSNRGFTYSLLGNYEDAINDFDKVIANFPTSAYPFANRGYAKIKLGKIEEGLADIKIALSIDNNCAYAYRNLGIYHLDIGDYEEAVKQFEIAHQLDPNAYMLDEYSAMAKKGIGIKTN